MDTSLLITLSAAILFFVLLAINIVGTIYWRNLAATEEWITLKILPSRLNERNPHVAESIFSAIHGIYTPRTFWEKISGKKQPHFSCEFANIKGRINFFIRAPKKYHSVIEGQFYAHYPEAEIYDAEDYTANIPENSYVAELEFTDTDYYPIKRYSYFEDKIARTFNDPLAGLTLPLAKEKNTYIQLVLQPLNSNGFRRRAIKALRIINKGHYQAFFKLSDLFEEKFMQMGFWNRLRVLPYLILFWILRAGSAGTDIKTNDNPDIEMSRGHERENDMTAASDKISRLVFSTAIRIVAPTPEKIREIAGGFKQFNIAQLNGFDLGEITQGKEGVTAYRKAEIYDQMIMNNEEIATIYHLPNITVSTPNIEWVTSKKLEPPADLPQEGDITFLGKTNFRGHTENFGIREDDRRRHIYIVGKTGMGKSTLLENMIFSDIQSGKGLAVIDPHGDLADAVINFVPPHRTNDVIIFDPSDTEFPVSFNMLECANPANRHLVASGVVGVFKKIFGESWGPRLEHILRNTLLALIEAQGTTMLGIMRILVDDKYRQGILRQVSDPMVLSFWNDEFARWKPQQQTEAISPIQNKVGQFLSSALVRNILGQPKSSIDLRFAMDKGKIIIVNLSKGKIGEDNSSLLGAMMVTKFQLDVMSRADTVEKERKDFYLYVDEFQNFATDSFATILSEARKYRLNLTVANQYLAQMADEVREAVFGNVGTMIAFQVGFDDAEVIANQFNEEILPADIGSLAKYQIYLRMMIDGLTSRTFSANTLPPPAFTAEENRREKITKASRERYAKPRNFVEEKIQEWVKK